MMYILSGRNPGCRKTLSTTCKTRMSSAFQPQVKMLQPRAMNSYRTSYQTGDMIVHFAGGLPDEKVKLMKEWLKKVVR